MTVPSVLQSMDDTCIHCGQLVRWVPAPDYFKRTGYHGYWYHPAGETVFCGSDPRDKERADPVGTP